MKTVFVVLIPDYLQVELGLLPRIFSSLDLANEYVESFYAKRGFILDVVECEVRT